MHEIKLVGKISTAPGENAVADGVSAAVVLTGSFRVVNGQVTEFILNGDYEIQDHGRIVCTPNDEAFRA